MIQGQQFRLFKAFGITVYLHWTWFLVAVFQIQRRSAGDSLGWAIAEYLTLFGIVLLHEFGHALACRQVGGTAHEIVLWPLGGIAFVNPPARPGAQLWSIAAGPLVNVMLAIPITTAFVWTMCHDVPQGIGEYIRTIMAINTGLLIFNILPIYPLDGGQILRSLLWYPLGPGQSLRLASGIGCLGSVALGAYAVWKGSFWTGAIAVFLLGQSFQSFGEARRTVLRASIPRRAGFSCPVCNTAPVQGSAWLCGGCHKPFDIFEHHGICPSCGKTSDSAPCPECNQSHSFEAWSGAR